MAFVVTQRIFNASREFAAKLGARSALTPQERANLYVSRMPIAVVSASLGGHPSDLPAGHR